MRISIVAVGRLKAGPERALIERYAKRLDWPLDIREIEVKGRLAGAKLLRAEGERLLARTPEGARLVALDERGKVMASREFADLLARWRDDGVAEVAFLIGGADGLADEVRARADRVIAFGPATWPHMLVRVMLAEQIYRASSILAGHPYHRD